MLSVLGWRGRSVTDLKEGEYMARLYDTVSNSDRRRAEGPLHNDKGITYSLHVVDAHPLLTGLCPTMSGPGPEACAAVLLYLSNDYDFPN